MSDRSREASWDWEVIQIDLQKSGKLKNWRVNLALLWKGEYAKVISDFIQDKMTQTGYFGCVHQGQISFIVTTKKSGTSLPTPNWSILKASRSRHKDRMERWEVSSTRQSITTGQTYDQVLHPWILRPVFEAWAEFRNTSFKFGKSNG